ncbi:MAG: hypothetical protein NZU63_07690 [Gemmataceae bacterium]|nr:hypothetical protein [Gemmataceae bacterium]
MRCHEARWWLHLRRVTGPDELGLEVLSALEAHLQACDRCAVLSQQLLNWEQTLSVQLKRISVPADLKTALLTQAAAAHGRSLRLRLYRLTAAAAAGLLLVTGGWLVYQASRPVFDPQQLVLDNDAWLQDPVDRLQTWLRQEGLPLELPEPFDANLLEQAGYERVQGHLVPVLVFRHPERAVWAKVYILRHAGPFRLEHLTSADASHTVAQIVEDPQRFGRVAFVIVYPAGPEGLRPFLRPVPASS